VSEHRVFNEAVDHGTPTIRVRTQSIQRTLIVDSGSYCSVLQPEIADYPAGCTNRSLFCVTGDTLKVKREETVFYQMEEVSYHYIFLIFKLPTTTVGILGTDFLKSRHTNFNLDEYTLTIVGNWEKQSVL
jgi:hypothetical protein